MKCDPWEAVLTSQGSLKLTAWVPHTHPWAQAGGQRQLRWRLRSPHGYLQPAPPPRARRLSLSLGMCSAHLQGRLEMRGSEHSQDRLSAGRDGSQWTGTPRSSPFSGVLPKRASPCLREACGIKASCLLWQPTHLLSWLPSLACLTSPPLHCASWDNLQSQIKHRTMDRGLLLRKFRRRACKVIELTSHSNERTMKDQEPLLVKTVL